MTSEKEGRRIVKAEEILGKIERGEPVDCNNIDVRGDLELSPHYLLKLKSENELTTYVTSSIQIKNSIICGNLNFDNTIFLSYLDFEGTCFEGRVSFSNAKFHYSARFSSKERKTSFKKYANFQDATFIDFANFENTSFEKDANFNYARFKDVVFFKKAKFCQTADFGGAEFETHASFKEANFNAKAYFTGVNFGTYLQDLDFRNGSQDNLGAVNFVNSKFFDYVNFSESNFNGDPNFTNASFEAEANFLMANFFGDTSFMNAIFKNRAIFTHSKFYIYIALDSRYRVGIHTKDVYFTDVEFNNGADFSRGVIFFGNVKFYNSKFGGKALFRDCRFCGISDFSGCEFYKDAFFRKAVFNKTATFWGSRFYEDAYFNDASFYDNINLKESRFKRFDVEWTSIKYALNHNDNDRAVYLSMIKNFKDLGYFDDADNCIYMYREKFFNRIDPCDWLSRIIQYGVKLRNPFILILLSSTFLILMRYKYETGDLHIVLAELILIGIFLPILVVVLARKLIR